MALAENIVLGVAQSVDEVLASEQYAFRELFSELRVGGESRESSPKPGYLMKRTPTVLGAHGPALDADGECAAREARPEPIRAARRARRGREHSRVCGCSTSAGTGRAPWPASSWPTWAPR